MTSRGTELHAPGSVAAWRAARELEALAPELGWSEATGLVDALVEALAHRCLDVARGRDEPTPLPLVAGAVGGPDQAADHASCRAAAARLRATASTLRQQDPDRVWVVGAAQAAADLAELLDHVADRTRTGGLRPSDKGVVLRRLHAVQRQLRAGPGRAPASTTLIP